MNLVHPSAGVYTNEIDLSQRVTGVSTSIGALVGAAARGPVNKPVLVTDTTELINTFGEPNAKKYQYMMFAADTFIRESSQLYIIRLVNGALTAGAYLTVDDPEEPSPNLSLTNFDDGSNVPKGVENPERNLDFNPGDSDLNSNLLFFYAANPGEWNNHLSIKVKPSTPKGLPEGQGHDPRHFFVEVYENYTGPNNSPTEKFFVSRRETEVTADSKAMFVEEVINNQSKLIRVKNNPYAEEQRIVKSAFEFLAGGTDGDKVTDDQVAEGWNHFDDPEIIDVNILINAGYTEPFVQRKIVQVAEDRKDATALLDTPFSAHEVVDAVNFRREDLNVNSSYAAMYAPWVQVRDIYSNRKMWLPPSGHVAAVYAANDADRRVWFAPAGLNRGNLKVLGVRKKYNQGHRDALDKAQINAIRFFPGKGYAVWGQQTMQVADSALSNVNVRRLINFIKKSIATAAIIGVFDPNDSFLRLRLQSIAEGFLEPIRNGRGLYDYDVIVDERNNTPETIANGDIIMDVYADPTIPVKQIHLTAHIQPTGSFFDEG